MSNSKIQQEMHEIHYMDFMALQEKIHTQNVDMGWWDEPRGFTTFTCLFHSELSEAMEGDRKGMMDDHLPEYKMAAVELADFVIRVMDWLASESFDRWYDADSFKIDDSGSFCDCLAWLHHSISIAMESMCRRQNKNKANQLLASAAFASFKIAHMQGWDLMEIINKKHAYNKHRADHKKENRKKEGGKKY